MPKKTLAIGDVHGHLDRLETLLLQEGIIDVDGTRINDDVEVVQLGDLGHFGSQTKGEDKLTWETAPSWLDVILWGNHDRAVIERKHVFGGYATPYPETEDVMKAQVEFGKLK